MNILEAIVDAMARHYVAVAVCALLFALILRFGGLFSKRIQKWLLYAPIAVLVAAPLLALRHAALEKKNEEAFVAETRAFAAEMARSEQLAEQARHASEKLDIHLDLDPGLMNEGQLEELKLRLVNAPKGKVRVTNSTEPGVLARAEQLAQLLIQLGYSVTKSPAVGDTIYGIRCFAPVENPPAHGKPLVDALGDTVPDVSFKAGVGLPPDEVLVHFGPKRPFEKSE